MAALIIDVKEDLEAITKLQEKIKSLKQLLLSMPSNEPLINVKGVEDELKNARVELNHLLDSINKAQNLSGMLAHSIRKVTESLLSTQNRMTESGFNDVKSQPSQISSGKSVAALKEETNAVNDQIEAYNQLKTLYDNYMGDIETRIIRMDVLSRAIKKHNDEISKIKNLPTNPKNDAYLIQSTKKLEKAKQELTNVRREITALVKDSGAVPTSMNAISQSLARMRSFYRQLSEEERNSLFGQELAQSIKEADTKIKELDATIGNHQRNVGNYAMGLDNVRVEYRHLIADITSLALAYRKMTAAEKESATGQELKNKIDELISKAAELKDAMADTNRAVASQANDTAEFDAVNEGIQLIISGFGAATGAAEMLGISEEDLVAVQTKLQSAFVAGNALMQSQNILQKESALMQGIAILQTKAATIAENLKTAAVGKGIIATKAATMAQGAFNLVATANPYVVLASAILSVVGAFWAYREGASAAERQAQRVKEASINATAEYHREIKGLDGLKSALEKAEKGSGEWYEIKNSIVDQYGKYLSNLDLEIAKVGDLSTTYDKLTKSIRKSAVGRQLAKYAEEDLKPVEDEIAEISNEIFELIPENLFTRDGRKLGDAFRRNFMDTLNKAMYSGNGDYVSDALNRLNVVANGNNLQSKIKSKAILVTRKYGEKLQGYEKIANSSGFTLSDFMTYSEATNQSSDTIKHPQEIEIENKIKELKNQLHLLDSVNAKGKKGDEIRKQIEHYEEELKAWSTQKEKLPINENTQSLSPDPIKAAEQSAKAKELLIKGEKELSRWMEDAEIEATQARIDARDDGSRKMLEQMELDHKKELMEIQREKEDLLAAHIDKAKAIHEAEENAQAADDPSYQKKTFDSSTISLSEDEETVFANRIRRADIEYERQRERWLDMQEQSWLEYFEKYGTYQEKRQAIILRYDKELEKLEKGSGEEALMLAEKQKALDGLDRQYKDTAQAMADLFEDASEKSVGSIQKVIDKYDTLVKYMSGTPDTTGHQVTMTDLKDFGFTDEDIRKINEGEISIKDITDAIKILKDELEGKSPWNKFVGDLQKGIGKIKNAKGDSIALGEGLSTIGNSVSTFMPSIKEFGDALGSIFGNDSIADDISAVVDAMAGLGTTTAGVGQIISGDIVGGVMNAVNGVSQMVDPIERLFGADYTQYNKMVDEYNALSEVWDILISKKREYISTSFGVEAINASNEAKALINKKIDSNRVLGKERLNSGASSGSHSIGVRQSKGMSSEGWDELRTASRDIGFDYDAVAGGRMTGLFDLTAAQLEQLQEKAPVFWAKLDGDTRQYLQNIIDCNDEIEKMDNLLKENLTSVTFDSLRDSFHSSLMDMDKDARDFSKDLSRYLMEAVLNAKLKESLDKELEEWYDKWAEYSESDSHLDSRELEELQRRYNEIVEKGIAIRDEAAAITGYDSASPYTQEPSKGVYEGLSQDLGMEMNGRMTAIQDGVGRIEQLEAERNEILRGMSALDGMSIADINSDNLHLLVAQQTEAYAVHDDVRRILAESYVELSAIRENTGAIVKPIKEIRSELSSLREEIRQNL